MRGRLLFGITCSVTVAFAAPLALTVPTSASAASRAVAAPAARPLYLFNTGLVFTVAQRAGRGAAVRVAQDVGRSGQRWIVTHGTIRPAMDEKLCLNVTKYRRNTPLELWTCDGKNSENLRTYGPSAHSPVFFAGRHGYCLTSLGDDTVAPLPGDKVGLEPCASLADQALSWSNLDGQTSYLASQWVLQALKPTAAGSAVTGSSLSNGGLDQYWVSPHVDGNSSVEIRPVTDTSLCATLSGPEAAGSRLTLKGCDGSSGQQFSGIEVIYNALIAYYYLTTPDTHYCVQGAASGSSRARPIVIGACTGVAALTATGLDLQTSSSLQFQEIYGGTGSLEYSMRVAGSGAAGSDVVLSYDDEVPAQVWTDLTSTSDPQSNANGSITLRPLSDESLCLTVPAGDYAAGTELTVQTCNGAVDQQFVRGVVNNPTDLVAAGDGEFCVAMPGGIKAGTPIELEPCAQTADESWQQFDAWYGWGGVPLSATDPAAEPGDAVVLSGDGQVNVSASPGPAGWYTSQDWNSALTASGAQIQSFYDPALCLDAPGSSAGTQLAGEPCTGSSGEIFEFGRAVTAGGIQWILSATVGKGLTEMCVAAGSAGSGGAQPLELEQCSTSQPDQGWIGPSEQL
jgi:hypothetical protein